MPRPYGCGCQASILNALSAYLWLGEVVVDDVAHRRCPRGYVQLLVDEVEVADYRRGGDHQPLGDVVVGETVSDEEQHLQLARCQAGRPPLRHHSVLSDAVRQVLG